MCPRYAHRSDLRVQALGERLAQGMHTSADASLPLQDQGLMTGALQLVGRHEFGHTCSNNQDFLWSAVLELRPDAVPDYL